MQYKQNCWSRQKSDTVSFIQNYKADGAVGNGIVFAIVGDHENRPTDMTNILVIYEDASTIKSNCDTETLPVSMGMGSGYVPIIALGDEDVKKASNKNTDCIE